MKFKGIQGELRCEKGIRIKCNENMVRLAMSCDTELHRVALHETAVSWLRRRLVEPLPRSPWEETSEEYGARLKACAADINEHHNVNNLCRGLPARLNDLKALEGDRLGH